MRVLIVGPGYIGLPLGAELARRNHEVFGLRRSGDIDGSLNANGIQTLTADIADLTSLRALPSPSFDWVVNCVSSSHGGVEDYRRVYLQGARNLVDWLGRHLLTKFVYTSSSGVYGQNDGSWVNESAATEPLSETSRVLIEAERVFLDAARELGFPAMVLRVAGIYGPGRSWWVRRILEGEARIEGEGHRALNMIHRDDVVGAIIAALEQGRAGEVYNAVDDEPVAQQEFLGWLAGKLGRPLPPAVAESVETNRKRGVSNKRISNQKLKHDLGYVFKHPTFREGYSAVLAER
jgi:nucleoside-diphosphate-sugar epimerase